MVYQEPDPTSRPTRNLLYAMVDQGSGVFSPLPLAATLNSDGLAEMTSGGRATTVSVTPTVTASSAYTTGNLVGTGAMAFQNVLGSAGSGLIQSITLQCKSVQSGAFKVAIFSANPSNTTWTDKTAPSINAADIPALVGIYSLSSPSSALGTHTIYNLDAIGKAISFGSTTLYAVLVTSGAPTFSSTTDVTLSISVIQN